VDNLTQNPVAEKVMLAEGLTDREIFFQVLKDFLLKSIIIYSIAVTAIVLIGRWYPTVGLLLAALFVGNATFQVLQNLKLFGRWMYSTIRRSPVSWYITMTQGIRWLQTITLLVYCFYLYRAFLKN
jgi:hypothetical protein